MCALTGTLFIYQGQEIGMINVPKTWPIDDFQDIESLNFYKSIAKSTNNDKEALDYVMRSLQVLGRDNARLPMQWDSSPFAGFTNSEKGAWMRVHDLYPEINVARQLEEPDSTFNFWKSMIQYRKEHRDVFIHGTFEIFEPANEQTFVFTKTQGNKKAAVILNFTSDDQHVELPLKNLTFCVSNYDDARMVEETAVGESRALRPWEGRLYMIGC